MIDLIQLASEYILIPHIVTPFVYLIGFWLSFVRGGLKRNLPYFFTLVVSFQYLYISPTYFYYTGITEVLETDISRYYGIGAWIYLFSISLVMIGYNLINTNLNKQLNAEHKEVIDAPFKIISLYVLFLLILAINLALGGFDLAAVIFGREKLGLGAKGLTYFLMNFSDSLITTIILASIFKIHKALLGGMILMAFFLFILQGFRYRVILTLFGLFFWFIINNKISFARFIYASFACLIGLYFILAISLNRYYLYSRNYEKINLNPVNFDYYILVDQTRGALADFASFQLLTENYGTVKAYRFLPVPEVGIAQYDYGKTMFIYPFIRMIPRAIYPDKDRFYPEPTLMVKDMAYNREHKHMSGEAVLYTGELFLSFGWAGILFGSFFLGIILKIIQNNINQHAILSVTFMIVFTCALFQWLTRGFMPQFIDHLVYMSFPIIILGLIRNWEFRIK